MECWSTPPQWQSKVDVTGYLWELVHAVVYAGQAHPKYALWVTCLVTILVTQELGNFQLPRNMYRSLQHGAVHYLVKHEVIFMDVWPNNGPQHLITVSVHSKRHQ